MRFVRPARTLSLLAPGHPPVGSVRAASGEKANAFPGYRARVPWPVLFPAPAPGTSGLDVQ